MTKELEEYSRIKNFITKLSSILEETDEEKMLEKIIDLMDIERAVGCLKDEIDYHYRSYYEFQKKWKGNK